MIQHHTEATGRKKTLALALGALGVVYGDIGTSPLYAIRECFHGIHAITPSPANIQGVISLVFWSLAVVISLKYVTFILRADNKGEGGIYALMALLPQTREDFSGRFRSLVILIGIFGAALLYGDGIITPAISVLSAVEGLKVAAPDAGHIMVPLTCGILIGLFALQHRGTAGISRIFGPIMLVWFTTIAVLGLHTVARAPEILNAVNPMQAVRFFMANHLHGFVVLGSVVLCITGGEALYADLGHFSKPSIRLSWAVLVWPALLCNYFGQGALLLMDKSLAFNPFYAMAPKWLLYPLVLLSTLATIIASQAMISGVFSLTQQAIQLGVLPRLKIVHTSDVTKGQIYLPWVNWTLLISCLLLVLTFRNSSRLAGAYGIAVTATMGITSIIYYFVITRTWGWPAWRGAVLVGLFLLFDLTYFGSNLLKVLDGGWLTLSIAALLTLVMIAWRDGRTALAAIVSRGRIPEDVFFKDVEAYHPLRVSGTAVFMTVSPSGIPSTVLHHFKFNKVFHERVIILSIITSDTPNVDQAQRLQVQNLGFGFYRVLAFFGFREQPNVQTILGQAGALGLEVNLDTTTYILGREILLTTGKSTLGRWRSRLFTFMSRNALNPTNYFGLPPTRVVELGVQIEI